MSTFYKRFGIFSYSERPLHTGVQFLGELFAVYSSVVEGENVLIDMEINKFFLMHTQVAIPFDHTSLTKSLESPERSGNTVRATAISRPTERV